MSHTNKQMDVQALKRSVVDFPSQDEVKQGPAPFILSFASFADTIEAWGRNIKLRDKQLREFFPTESMLASAVYSTSIRNASFDWEIVGADPSKPKPKNTIAAVTRMLRNFDRGRGWVRGIVKTFVDLYTQDNGAFWEVIRSDDKPDAPVLNIAPLDAGRCRRTGNPLIPVIYTDRRGREHLLKWYQVVTLEEFPVSIENLYNIQICAVSRALRAAQILRDVAIYKHEKVSGQNTRAISFVSGVSRAELEEALELTAAHNENKGFVRYSQPVVIPGVDPTNPVSVATIDIASLPDGYDEETTYKWYLAQLALAFGVDYQEFAPLPGGALGSGHQAEILHLKTRGKGPAMIMALLEHVINFSGIIPANVRFTFKQADVRAESEKAEARFLRGKDRALRLNAGELDAEAAMQLAVQDGDLPEYMLEDYKRRLEQSEAMIRHTDDRVIVSSGVGTGSRLPDNARIDDLPANISGGMHTYDKQVEMCACGHEHVGEKRIRISPRNRPKITKRDIQNQREILVARLSRDNRGKHGRKGRSSRQAADSA